ncbi:MAG TPA: hypothetical protein PLR88_02305 [Bacteroidales bacterium]|nr:hypothetical protein [Bacteroidales bacterium]
MNHFLRILFFLIVVFSFSCEEHGYNMKCSDCFEEEPEKAELEIKLGKDGYFKTLVKIYEGNLEDSVLLAKTETTSASFYYMVNLNKTYTATATYVESADTYIAVDSATPRVKYDEDKCDDPCYFVYDRILDLRLKYTK